MNSDLLRLVTDRRLWRGPAPGVVLLLLLTNVVVALRYQPMEERLKKNLLVDDKDTNKAILANGPIRDDRSWGANPLAYWRHIPDATTQGLVIISGMSQLFAINERKDSDRRISECLDDALAPRGVRAFGLAAPNLCNEEALFLLLAASGNPRTKPTTFIYAVCFDKFRNLYFRTGYEEYLKSSQALQHEWNALAVQYADQFPLATDKMLQTLELLHETEGKDTSIEARVQAWISAVSPLVNHRGNLNALLRLNLFHLRNAVFAITPTSKRPIIKSRYNINRQFLEMMVAVAQQRRVQIILYIVPLNPLADNPYIPREYDSFKRWIQSFAEQHDVPFANLEDIVPPDEWGEFMGGPDFKHFKGSGHRRTADALLDRFGSIIIGAAAEHSANR